ncbi:MAG: RICIN domain-containing protein [Carboxylicivirga sp.]|jgi:hypothetical protein|nr:RICIN domain-containing protein [Carboxylicivirga sp.]
MRFFYLKSKVLLAVIALTFHYSTAQTPISSLTRDQILQRYAPVLHMGVKVSSDYYDGQDLLVRVDHDKNWGTYDDDTDIWASGSNWVRTTLARDVEQFNANHDVTPIVYGSMIELSDFYILKYGIYHTYNEIEGSIGDHLNDMESIEVIVDKSGNVKGALTTVHSTSTWGTPWAGDENMDIFDNYSSSTYTLHLHNGTHPQVWIGSNGNANLVTKSHGHAIFVQNEWMDSRGVDYYPSGVRGGIDELDVPQQASSIGYEISGWGYSSSARYLLVPMEELLVKAQMEKTTDLMFHLGQHMNFDGGQFFGNGWFGFATEGGTSSANDLRYRYNHSYSGPDMGYNYMYKPLADIGHTNPEFQLNNIGGLALPNDISGFYRNSYANIPGSGYFDNNGNNSQDLLSMMETVTSGQEFSVEAGVRRVGKLWLNENWYSNPYNKSYINGTGPTGGIMLRTGQAQGDNFIYIGWAPEKDKIVYMQRNASLNNGQTSVEYLDIDKYNRLFKVDNTLDGSITIYAKDYRKPDENWEQIKQVDGVSLGLDGNIYASLVTQSDVNSTKNYYWTNGEYVHVKTTGIEVDPIVEPGYYKVVSKNSGKVIDVSGISQDDGANICQWEYVGGENQQWKIEQVENGKYRFMARHSGKVLDVYSWSTANGGNIVQWPWVNYENQKWRIDKVDDTYFTITSCSSNKVLDVDGISSDNGANVQQWDYVGQSNQQWQLVKVADVLKSGRIQLDTHVEDQEEIDEVLVYPNPVDQGWVNVKFKAIEKEASQVKIYSASGLVVHTKDVQIDQGINNVNIELSGIVSGIYFLELYSDKNRFVKQLVVK